MHVCAFMEEALLGALYLTLRNLAVPQTSHGQCNNDAHGYVISVLKKQEFIIGLLLMVRVYHIRRGLRRCSFLLVGQCQSLEEWDE